MKKILIALLIIACIFTVACLSACDGDAASNDGDNLPNTDQNTPDVPSEPEVPEEPDLPSEPEVPNEPDLPSEPEIPNEPDLPSEPEVDEVVGIKATYNGTVVLGGAINKNDFSVKSISTSGKEEVISDFSYSAINVSTAGYKKVTVTSGEFTTEVMIKVAKNASSSKVYYSNSLNWKTVYAYCWNATTGETNAGWPGVKCTDSTTNDFGETVYSYTADKKFDRIIFNNGSGSQTFDLIISECTSAYYGINGVYTYGASDYGTIKTVSLSDSKFTNKKVHIYTPSGYNPSGDVNYGVLYMFDGQNIFVNNGSYVCSAGNSWAVDRAVTSFMANNNEGIIVVGIDNGNSNRDSELTMSLEFGELTSLGSPQYGSFRNGILDEMGDFITDTVMPYVNANYKVDTAREKTGIAGSSSGGLGAFYVGLREKDIFGYVGAFSPATSLFYNNAWQKFLSSLNLSEIDQKMYIYCGYNADELENMLYTSTGTEATSDELKSLLVNAGYNASNIKEYYWNGATHNEIYWRIAFMDFLSFALA